ncbi:phospholipase DDHD1b isoform X2 [Phyllopteryx taeniolatus]|uniref:phospholipase DDHD1b isoform X2 n=1 Tax=Phyllopteryx taeniolatus TaxID=161469 RepID=UPI002AD2B2A8|nr:phospholipase DDHD1b isoform X2 [Phyllopteryx taeniolatus]
MNIRQQSSDNNSVSSSEWDMANDVFVSGYDEHPTGTEARAGGGCDPAEPGLDRHLPLLPQDGLMLGLSDEEYSRETPSYLDIERSYSESDSNATSKKRVRSNSSRHRGEIVTELGPEEVRWFYKEDKRAWKPFVGHDSLKIESAYARFAKHSPDEVKRPREPVESRRKDAAEDCRRPSLSEEMSDPDGTGTGTGTGIGIGTGTGTGTGIGIGMNTEAVCVRGGLYEVDVREKECYPVYWNQQDRIPVMRGQWFIDATWLPLEEDESDMIEQEHLARFRGQQMRDTYEMEVVTTTVDSKDAIHSLKLSRSHVDWQSVDLVYLYSDATTSKIARTVTQKLGFSKASSSGTRLHRGYVEEAAPEDTPPETTHIVFVVHGIGQKMDQGRIIRNTSMMRDAARKMEEKHFPNRTTEHVEFLPVEWRSKLALDGDTVDTITPDKLRGLRDMLNSSAMDIMYYTSPLYRDEITRGLTLELNRLYSLFCSRNPDFEKNGKVSIVSHSLGCVITFDIMTGWDPVRFHHLEVPDPEETKARWPSVEERQLQEQLRLTRLRLRDLEDQFQGLQTLSCVAVPAMKFKAYRLEPLILKHYSNIAPVQIHWYNTTSPTPYDQIRLTLLNLPKETTSISDSESLASPCTSPPQARRHYGESITSLGKASIMGAASLGKGIGGILFSRFSRSSCQVGGMEEEPSDFEGRTTEAENAAGEKTVLPESDEKEKLVEEEQREIEQPMSQSTSVVMDHTSLELERRMDFELREGLVESRYWSAVTSHTAYWCSYDVALFLLTFMYRPQEPPETAEDNTDAS